MELLLSQHCASGCSSISLAMAALDSLSDLLVLFFLTSLACLSYSAR